MITITPAPHPSTRPRSASQAVLLASLLGLFAAPDAGAAAPAPAVVLEATSAAASDAPGDAPGQAPGDASGQAPGDTLSSAAPDSLAIVVDSSRTLGETILGDLEVVVTDAADFLRAPGGFGAVEWGITGGVLGGTVATMALDGDLRTRVRQGSYSIATNDVLTEASRYGEVLIANILTGTVWVTGLVAGSDEIRITGRMLAQSLLYSGAVTMTLRYILGRQRPYRSDSQWRFELFQSNNEVQSFPSGHTTVAFALSSVLAARIDHPVATALLYSAATLTAASRIYLDRHWTSDVVMGAAVGIASGLFVAHAEMLRSASPPDTSGHPAEPRGLLVTPTFNGLAIVYRF